MNITPYEFNYAFDGSFNYWAWLYFNNTGIPQGTILTKSRVIYNYTTPVGGSGGNITIYGYNAAIPTTPIDYADAASKPKTTASVVKTIPASGVQQLFEVWNICQEIVNRSDFGSNGTKIGFLISGSLDTSNLSTYTSSEMDIFLSNASMLGHFLNGSF